MSDATFARLSLVEARAPVSAFNPLRPRLMPGRTPPTMPADTAEPDLFALGFAAGEQVASEAFATERTALGRLVAAAQALQPEPSEELAAMIAATVEQLVTELVGKMPVERDWLEERIERAMSCIAKADAARVLRLHPDDIDLLADTAVPLALCPDPELQRGELRIECSQGWIEDGRSQHLDALRVMLGTGSQS
jgi:flagellar assembly protein FliH